MLLNLRGAKVPILLALALSASAQVAQIDPLFANFDKILVHRERAFVIGDPIFVAGPQVKAAKWSWDGAYLLIEQEVGPLTIDTAKAAMGGAGSMSVERVISLYRAATGQAEVLFREDARQFKVEDFDWLLGGEALMLVSSHERQPDDTLVTEPKQSLFRINPASGRATPFAIDRGEVLNSIQVEFAPDGSHALVSAAFDGTVRTDEPGGEEIEETSFSWQIVRSDLSLLRVQLPEGALSMSFLFAGSRPYALTFEGGAAGRRRGWYSMNPVDGALTPSTQPDNVGRARLRPAQLLQTRQTTASATNNTRTTQLSSVWLETREPTEPNRIFLAGDADLADVAPGMRAVSYSSHGSLYLRPVQEISYVAYRQLKEEYERTMAMRRAKEISIGFLMYGADHEDTYPSSRSDYASLIAPYLKDLEVFEGFLYTFPGGLVTEAADPSKTQLGFIELANGRAVAFLDGHVEWLPHRR